MPPNFYGLPRAVVGGPYAVHFWRDPPDFGYKSGWE